MSTEQFGPNAWLIEEMYRQYLDNPKAVSEAWQEFFEDYRPRGDGREPEKVAPPPEPEAKDAPEARALAGVDAVIARNMEQSLSVPTATSVRDVPAKLLEVNRQILNNHLARSGEGKVSFTHLIGWAVIKALREFPRMNSIFRMVDGKPNVVNPPHINLGLAVDVRRDDGSRTLLVPNIKKADTLSFRGYFDAYEDLIARISSLSPDDFAGTTVSITNPGTIGTVMSVPRLMSGQAVIVGVGALQYPAEYRGSDPRALAEIGVGKIVTLTSTYDHRVIQGALSGEFLGRIESFLLGADGFYEEVFVAMGIPYVPVRWRMDSNPRHDTLEWDEKQAHVLSLINLYRVRGHLIADLDPLEAKEPSMHLELDPASHGLSIWDLDREFIAGGLTGRPKMKLSEILGTLRDAYCRTFTVEYMHIQEPEQKAWIQQQVEGVNPELPPEDKKHVLRRLTEADVFETFLHKKYVGHKRFSLEGAETLIPILDNILENAAEAGMEEVVIGMSHRGRLNVLANIVGKSYRQIFDEFEGDIDPETAQGSGDVKYHIGAEGKFVSRSGRAIDVSVASNPSHLESVDPVVEGIVRAKQDLKDRGDQTTQAILIHGDAAFAGQGVVAETLNLSALHGYGIGGTIHVIVNNQLGFTTGSDYGRSSQYASDVARMIQAPVFHVNGEDPRACVRAANLAFQFRQAFRKDVVIDMWCYRRWGHNEADEPSFTQPLMYARIENRRSIRKLYTERLVNSGDLAVEEAEAALQEFRDKLRQAFDETIETSPSKAGHFLRPIGKMPEYETGVDRTALNRAIEALSTIPEGFNIHPKLAKWIEQRRAALSNDAIDWSLGEALAMGTLLLEGKTVRLSGQDTRRGTFSQRHSTLVDQVTAEEYVPLHRLETRDGKFFVYDSLLSEFAALGFEYGYSVGNPDALVMWEAQFGDFVNGGQITIDQFIVAGEDKWGQQSGLVLLLPHGYEGQGPEHSSARLERFLQQAAEDNILVAAPTTPSQFFHLLRRQAYMEELRRPLMVMTPKSFLRLPAARSAASEFEQGTFRLVLPDDAIASNKVQRVILCSGKFYYDLLERRSQSKDERVAVVRVEQLYPFPLDEIVAEIEKYPGATTVWAQEEPENMGAWRFVKLKLSDAIPDLRSITRPESASPATGSATAHQWEQNRLLDLAFSI